MAATAAKALALDNSLAEAHAALGAANGFLDYNWGAGEKEFQRAIELNPSYATAHSWYAQLLSAENRDNEALAESKRALEFDPLSLMINAAYAHHLYWARRYDEASAHLSHATLELDPNFPTTHWYLGLVYAQQKNFPEAIRARTAAAEAVFGNLPAAGLKGLVHPQGEKMELKGTVTAKHWSFESPMPACSSR